MPISFLLKAVIRHRKASARPPHGMLQSLGLCPAPPVRQLKRNHAPKVERGGASQVG